MRIIDLQSSQYSTDLKTIDFNFKNGIYRAKSRFLNDYTLSALGVSSSELIIFNISIPNLVIKAMNKDEYTNFIKKYKSDTFKLKIGYSNSHSSKYSNEFFVVIKDYGYSDSSSVSHLSIFEIMCISLIITIVIIICSWIAYKRLIGRKKKIETAETKIDFEGIEISRKGRLGLLINNEINY